MSTNKNPPEEFPPSIDPRKYRCYDTDSTVAALHVFADEHSYVLPYAQFLYSEMIPNPALEREPDAPPQKLLIRFATADVVVWGCGLNMIEHAIQKYELASVKIVDRRYAGALNTRVAAVSVTLTKESL